MRATRVFAIGAVALAAVMAIVAWASLIFYGWCELRTVLAADRSPGGLGMDQPHDLGQLLVGHPCASAGGDAWPPLARASVSASTSRFHTVTG